MPVYDEKYIIAKVKELKKKKELSTSLFRRMQMQNKGNKGD